MYTTEILSCNYLLRIGSLWNNERASYKEGAAFQWVIQEQNSSERYTNGASTASHEVALRCENRLDAFTEVHNSCMNIMLPWSIKCVPAPWCRGLLLERPADVNENNHGAATHEI